MKWRQPSSVLSQSQQRLMRNTIIDARRPGTLLHDFDVLLRLATAQPLPLTPMNQLLRPILRTINARLAHPLQHGLTQPLVESLPHVQGLYLLLRASGLTLVEKADGRPVLVVDATVLDSWNQFNATERYCTLLEAWLLRGKMEILSQVDQHRGKEPDAFHRWQSFLKHLSHGTLRIGSDGEAESALRERPGWCNLALLELFGLVSIRHGSAEAGKGWRIESLSPTPLGEALLALLYDGFWRRFDNQDRLRTDPRVPYGLLQPILQPYWPAWHRNLSPPEWTFRPGVHVFQVSLDSAWRRIAIPGWCSLESLVKIILQAVGFNRDHLYQLRYRNRFGIEEQIHDPEAPEQPRADGVRIGDLPLCENQELILIYDLRQSVRWAFQITLENLDLTLSLNEAVILEQRGRAPEQHDD